MSKLVIFFHKYDENNGDTQHLCGKDGEYLGENCCDAGSGIARPKSSKLCPECYPPLRSNKGY